MEWASEKVDVDLHTVARFLDKNFKVMVKDTDQRPRIDNNIQIIKFFSLSHRKTRKRNTNEVNRAQI